jgi:hypothetical protein
MDDTALTRNQYKGKYSRYRPEQAQRVDRGIALSFLDPGTRRGWVVSTTPWALYPRERPGAHYTGATRPMLNKGK